MHHEFKYKFLGNVSRDEDGRPVYCRFPDDPSQAVLPGDRLVKVHEGVVSFDTKQTDPVWLLQMAAEKVWMAMNDDYRPTGQYFRSMCTSDVAVIGDRALAALSCGFGLMDTVPEFEDGLTETELLAAMRA